MHVCPFTKRSAATEREPVESNQFYLKISIRRSWNFPLSPHFGYRNQNRVKSDSSRPSCAHSAAEMTAMIFMIAALALVSSRAGAPSRTRTSINEGVSTQRPCTTRKPQSAGRVSMRCRIKRYLAADLYPASRVGRCNASNADSPLTGLQPAKCI
jgi:hypothetical protein